LRLLLLWIGGGFAKHTGAVSASAGVVPEATGRPAYHPATLLKIYLYGYLNRIQSSRRLERETNATSS
jgi:transposase